MRTFCVCFLTVFFLATLSAADVLAPPVPAKVLRYAETMVDRYDQNGDTALQKAEWKKIPGKPQVYDLDGDQQITKTELVWYFGQYGRNRTIHRTVAVDLRDPYKFDPTKLRLLTPVRNRLTPEFIPPKSGLANNVTENITEEQVAEQITANEQAVDEDVYKKMLEDRQIPSDRPYHVLPETLNGVPKWFILQDRNGDGQVSLTEFVPSFLPPMIVRFKQFDRNGDGLIEPDEVR